MNNYHPCFIFDEIGRGTAIAVVGSSLSEPAIQKEEKMKNQDITHILVDRARSMRKEPTEEENKLWHLYLKK